ncbi:DNA helicase mcm9 [Clydaea vesicula]|uniref:DNA helicase n=1 Tax=Clydaea vesicula TaxID=447962 RepID=A0AAD5U079_9FUNG|nr:DNA helicase mcm9 [Clydaea vesicula]
METQLVVDEKDLVDSFSIILSELCQDQLINEMTIAEDLHRPVYLALSKLIEFEQIIANYIIQNLSKVLPIFSKCLSRAQELIKDRLKEDMSQLRVKFNLHLRIDCQGLMHINQIFRTKVPKCTDIGKFISFKGKITVLSRKLIGNKKGLLYGRGCQSYDREQYNSIPKPIICTAGSAPGAEPCDIANSCKDYQEVKVQEHVGTIPRSIIVILEDDLVDTCKAGDDITISGLVFQRFKTFYKSDRCLVEIALFSNHLKVHNEQKTSLLSDQFELEFKLFWENYKTKPFTARDQILKSFCPKIYGLFIVKLAVMLVLCGGVAKYDQSGLKLRGDPHILLVGDPGTGKSQFLRYAAHVSPRAVLTTGIGSTNAGLTVAAVRDGGEWQLEAGALVLADRGLCCIDEFGSIRENDKTAIHEAMEQQTVSVAKAGMYDPTQNLEVNIALGSPLLSRFDVIIVLLDSQNLEWDNTISNFILNNEISKNEVEKEQLKNKTVFPNDVENNANDKQSNHGENTKLWNLEMIQAYISYTKIKFQPKMTENSNLVLKSYYQLQRNSDVRNVARTTVRLLESLIRLSQAHARLTCKNEVSISDAIIAIMLIESSMQTSALMKITSALHAGFSKDPELEHFNIECAVLEKLGLEYLMPKQPTNLEEEANLNSNNELRNFSPAENQENLSPNISSMAQNTPKKSILSQATGSEVFVSQWEESPNQISKKIKMDLEKFKYTNPQVEKEETLESINNGDDLENVMSCLLEERENKEPEKDSGKRRENYNEEIDIEELDNMMMEFADDQADFNDIDICNSANSSFPNPSLSLGKTPNS